MTERKLELYNLLIEKFSKLLKMDTREADFFWEKFVENNDDMTDGVIRELFLVLKLQWGDLCPDFNYEDKKLEKEIKIIQKEKEKYQDSNGKISKPDAKKLYNFIVQNNLRAALLWSVRI